MFTRSLCKHGLASVFCIEHTRSLPTLYTIKFGIPFSLECGSIKISTTFSAAIFLLFLFSWKFVHVLYQQSQKHAQYNTIELQKVYLNAHWNFISQFRCVRAKRFSLFCCVETIYLVFTDASNWWWLGDYSSWLFIAINSLFLFYFFSRLFLFQYSFNSLHRLLRTVVLIHSEIHSEMFMFVCAVYFIEEKEITKCI